MISSFRRLSQTSRVLQQCTSKRMYKISTGGSVSLHSYTLGHYIGSSKKQILCRSLTSDTRLGDHSLSGFLSCEQKVSNGEDVPSIQARADSLVAETSKACNSAGELKKSSSTQMLGLIDEWYRLSKSCSIRTKSTTAPSQSSDAIINLERVKEICAENMDYLLQHHIQYVLEEIERKSKPNSLFIKKVKPNTKPFALTMEAWNQTCAPQAGKRTASILEMWGDLYGGDMNFAPTINEFNIVLDTYAKCSSGDYDSYTKDSYPAELAWELYSILSRLDDPTLLPNIASCSHLVQALSNHAFVMKYAKKTFETQMDSEIAAIRAYFIWKSMVDMINEKKEITNDELELAWRAHVNMLTMSSDAMLRRDDGRHTDDHLGLNVGRDTEELFVRLFQMHSDDMKLYGVSTYLSKAFGSVMKSWTKEQDARINQFKNTRKFEQVENQLESMMYAARSVTALLEFMKGHGVTPTPEHYASTIQAYAKCLNGNICSDNDNITKDILPQVRKLLSEMEIDHLDRLVNKQWDGYSVEAHEKIPASTFRTVIECFYHHSSRGFGHRNDNMQAAKILEKMMDLYDRDLLWIDRGQKPLTAALNRILRMFVDSRPASQDVAYATKIFDRFRTLESRKGGEDSKMYVPKLNPASYQIYLTLMSRSNPKDSSDGIKHALVMMEEDAVKLDIVHYVAAIKGLVKGGKGEDKLRAKELLFEAIDKYSAMPVSEQDANTFNASALYAAMMSPAKSSEAISLLKTLQKRYEETTDPSFKPDLVLYCTVLSAIATDRNIVPWKDELALEILGTIEEAYRNGDNTMMPNKFCFMPVIDILSSSKLPSASILAEDILERMNELYIRTGDENVKPDARAYIAVMKTLARSKTPSKAKKVWELCQAMESKFFDGDDSFKPSITTLSTVLNACAFTHLREEHEEALHIALKVQNALVEKGCYGEPDSIFYDSLIKVFGLLLKGGSRQQQREDLISATFVRCSKDGVVDERILSTIRSFFPKYYEKLPGYENGKVQLKSLPNKWTYNLQYQLLNSRKSR